MEMEKVEINLAFGEPMVLKDTGGGVQTIEGLAVPYGRPSKPGQGFFGGGVSLQFERGAFGDDFENNKNIWLYYGHDSSNILGRNTMNMRLDNRPDGIYLSADLDPKANDLTERTLSYVRMGFVDGLSLGTTASAPSEILNKKDGSRLLKFKESGIREVSVVGDPAFWEASVGLKMSNGASGEGPGALPESWEALVVGDSKPKKNVIPLDYYV